MQHSVALYLLWVNDIYTKVTFETYTVGSVLRSHNLVGSWDISLAVKPDNVGVAGANMQWLFAPVAVKRGRTVHLN